VVFAAIPSPSTGVVHLGSIPLRGYAFMIILGVLAAVSVTGRRLRARGVDPRLAGDAVVPAVLLGIVGARVYHVVSSPDGYFGAGGHVVDAFKIWEGGLSIWGAVAGGAVGVWLVCRRAGVSFGLFADAAAPGLALAQAVGRWGNWFNQELYGRPSDLPWAVEIDPGNRPDDPAFRDASTFHPTFLYESLWNLGVAGVLVLVDRRRRLGRGKLFALYAALYTAGRVWIEALRVDEAEKLFGLRVNIWVSILVFAGAVVAIVVLRRPVDPAVAPDRTDAAGSAAAATVGDGEAGGPAAGDGEEDGDAARDTVAPALRQAGAGDDDDNGGGAHPAASGSANAPAGGEPAAPAGNDAVKAK
jgi:prolipoprotein diacylglyceryl transferase